MKSDYLIVVDKIDYINDYKKAGIAAFLFPIQDYQVGYNGFTLKEIDKVDVSDKYLLLNKVMNCQEIDSIKLLKNQIMEVKNLKGIIIEDIGLYSVFKNNKDIKLILFQNHFATNYKSINCYLEMFDSIVVSNELTYDEIKKITEKANKKVCIHLYGYNQAMYSKRHLLSNWSNYFNLGKLNYNKITDKATKVSFNVLENESGTVMYSENIFNGKSLLDLDNVLFYYINPMLIEHEIVMDFLNNIDIHKSSLEDDGFLNKETIYKLKDVSR